MNVHSGYGKVALRNHLSFLYSGNNDAISAIQGYLKVAINQPLKAPQLHSGYRLFNAAQSYSIDPVVGCTIGNSDIPLSEIVVITNV